jgi:hypothetical protein
MSTDKYISELFFDYDCVILPGFGGFVASYAPASIHPTQHTFTPPYKKIVFNKRLVNNDGLLANHISLAENIPFSKAMDMINAFIGDCQARLQNGKKVELQDVGTLYLDVEKSIRFEPANTVNYLGDAYGLSEFRSPAIKRGSYSEGLPKTFKDREAIPLKVKKLNVKKYVALALSAPLIFAMIWVPLKTDLLHDINYSSLNPFQKNIATYQPRIAMPELIKLEDLSPKPMATTSADETVNANSNDESVDPVALSIETEKANIPSRALHFHIVGGCFEMLSNAENLVNEMTGQNMNASIIGKNKDGLHIVSLGDFPTREEAYAQLPLIRKNNPEAWLLKD